MTAMAASFDFRSELCFAIFDLQFVRIFPLTFQEKERKIDFQDGGNFGFPIKTILTIFDLQFIPMLSPSFKNGKRKVQGVPQSQTAALPRPKVEKETDKSKQELTEQTYEALRLALPSPSEVIAILKGLKNTRTK